MLIARNQHQISQNTYQRSKLLIQVNDVAGTYSLWSWIISLANAKSLFKTNFGHKFFICQPIFKIFAAQSYYDKFSSKYCWENILPPSKCDVSETIGILVKMCRQWIVGLHKQYN